MSINKTDKVAIVDIEGVLADNRHRQHILDKKGKKYVTDEQWDRFYDLLLQDTHPKELHTFLLSLVKDNWYIILLTDREKSGKKYSDTLNWLSYHEIPFNELLMRPAGDRRDDFIIKEEYLSLIIETERFDTIIAFDDLEHNIDMYKRNNITCFQVFLNKPEE